MGKRYSFGERQVRRAPLRLRLDIGMNDQRAGQPRSRFMPAACYITPAQVSAS